MVLPNSKQTKPELHLPGEPIVQAAPPIWASRHHVNIESLGILRFLLRLMESAFLLSLLLSAMLLLMRSRWAIWNLEYLMAFELGLFSRPSSGSFGCRLSSRIMAKSCAFIGS